MDIETMVIEEIEMIEKKDRNYLLFSLRGNRKDCWHHYALKIKRDRHQWSLEHVTVIMKVNKPGCTCGFSRLDEGEVCERLDHCKEQLYHRLKDSPAVRLPLLFMEINHEH